MRGVPFADRTMSIEVPYTDHDDTYGDTASSSEESHHQRRRQLHRVESVDTHMHFVGTPDPGLAFYRHEELQAVLDSANGSETVQARRLANQAVMEKLANLGVSVFLISHECQDVWQEVKHCILEASNMQLYNCSPDRCLLYEDERGRLFNLLAAGDFDGLAASYNSMLDKASGLEAICALVVLVRAFACVGMY